ncbi:hypothetical protein MKX68_12575 [Paenibacillus sp. FSL M8-0212]|uniref:hypothetical protein n=1 Tax=unclassified Paenibacillus TaxID=185978 RepID=UPI00209EC229|nr:hypothetical protein [Paenibacillus sp. 1781tsa1]MCP1187262.1 hypothetical protein [Paenibacillus sp. 1781tsa1]
MSKNKKIIMFFMLFLIIFTVYYKISESKKQDLYERVIPIGEAYFMEYYDAEIYFTRFDINTPVSNDIILYGYVKGDENTQVSLSIDLDTLEPQLEMGPQDFINKRKIPFK